MKARKHQRILGLLLGLVLGATLGNNGGLGAATQSGSHEWCGVEPGLEQRLAEQYRNDLAQRQQLAAAGKLRGMPPNDRIVGDIIVLEDNGTLVVERSPGDYRTASFEIIDRAIAVVGDNYDLMVIFNASDFRFCSESSQACREDADCNGGDDICQDFIVGPEAGFAFHSGINSNLLGINRTVFDSPDRTTLRGLLNMNSLARYPGGADAILGGFNGVVTGTEVFGHETGHYFLSFINAEPADMLGRGEAHWSFFLQTYGSVMEGNLWIDNGDGSFISDTTSAQFTGYSQLDEYLMGLRGIDELTDPIWVITEPSDGRADGSFPAPDIATDGVRVDITAEDLQAFNTARDPAYPDAPRDHAMAVILVVPGGTDPSDENLATINGFRNSFETFFNEQTEGRGSIHTGLNDLIPVSAAFRGQNRVGAAPLTVTFEDLAHGDVTSYLWEFGDGNSSTDAEPEHTYQANGDYTVTLTVEGVGGPYVSTRNAFVAVDDFRSLFFDNFENDRGWTVGPQDDATAGQWERGVPVESRPNGSCSESDEACFNTSDCPLPEDSCSGLIAQPGFDNSGEAGGSAFITGLLPGVDVDEGQTTLLSPPIDTRAYNRLYLSYARWYNNRGSGEQKRDVLAVEVSDDDGATWNTVERPGETIGIYRQRQFALDDLVEATPRLRLRFVASDLGDESQIEALIDDVALIGVLLPDADGDGVADERDNCVAAANNDQGDTDNDGEGNACDLDDDDDGLLDGDDNCPLTANPGQDNDDGDPLGDACDCANGDDDLWASPGDTGTLRLAHQGGETGTTELSWSPPSMPGSTSLSYDLIRAERPFDFATGFCKARALSTTETSDSDTPQALFFYLVRGENPCGEGSAGTSSAGVPRVVATCL